MADLIHKHLSELAFTQDPCSPEASHHRPTLAPPDTLGHAEQLLSNLKYGNHSMPTPGTAVAADPRLLAKVLSVLLNEQCVTENREPTQLPDQDSIR